MKRFDQQMRTVQWAKVFHSHSLHLSLSLCTRRAPQYQSASILTIMSKANCPCPLLRLWPPAHQISLLHSLSLSIPLAAVHARTFTAWDLYTHIARRACYVFSRELSISRKLSPRAATSGIIATVFVSLFYISSARERVAGPDHSSSLSRTREYMTSAATPDKRAKCQAREITRRLDPLARATHSTRNNYPCKRAE